MFLLHCLAALLLGYFPGDEPLRFNFESGDLQDWRVVEGGFDQLICDRANFHNHPKKAYNKEGKYFLTTLETASYGGNDALTGRIESPVFRITGDKIRFMVGGGGHGNTYVALCLHHSLEEVHRASGANNERMKPIVWDVSIYRNQLAFFRVVDQNTGPWGHITCDDFRFQGILDPEATKKNFKQSALYQVNLKALRAAVGENEELEDLIVASNIPGIEAFRKKHLLSRIKTRKILYVMRHQYKIDHHNTATLFQTGEINTQSFQGDAALKTYDLQTQETTTLLESREGVIRDPEIRFDGKKILFSMRRHIKDDAHIYEMDSNGANLKQLTFSSGVSDIDPLYLPDGDIVFSSTREPKYCMCNRHIMANLFRMKSDGANIHQIGKSTLFEGHGALLPDGRILYDRWEYVDRNFGDAQGLWTVNPDGTNHAIFWGNNTNSPGGVIDARPLGAHRIICILGSCHDLPWGAMAIIDRRLGVDGKPPVLRTWPESAVNLVGVGDFDTFKQVHPKYEDPYPLNDFHFLCSRMVPKKNRMGIYLTDIHGNEILLIEDELSCFDPMPLGPRPKPPVIPTKRDLAKEHGAFYVMDVYQGDHMEGVKRGTVKYLRVVESPEKRFWTHSQWGGQGVHCPAMNWHDFNNKRILGTVPVEEDGSAYFTAPADRFVYFQLLDDKGMMIQSMRSGTMAAPGEVNGCVGCHEPRRSAPPLNRFQPMAVARAPSTLEGWYGKPRFFNYMDEVQPVLDKNCAGCHNYNQPAGEKLNLCRDRTLTFNTSYNELWRKKQIHPIGAGPFQTQPAYSWGSHSSRIVEKILQNHNGVNLSREEFDRIVTWIDINAPYYPNYWTAYPDHLAGRSPLDKKQIQRLTQLTGIQFSKAASHNSNLGPQVSFDRPELSPCLRGLEPKVHQEALEIITLGKAALVKKPRADMAEFKPCPADLKREEKYLTRRRIEQKNRMAIKKNKTAYDK